MPTYKYISVTTNQNITTISLNRPEKKNAMSFAMMRELIVAANHVKQDKTVRAVILTGTGSDFCAGIDLSDLNQPKSQVVAFWELVKPTQSLFQKVNLCWRELPVPVIACIHGHCIGAGLQLALACDIRIATHDSKFSIMEAKWGLVADMGLTQSAYGMLSVDTLKELAMTARIIDAFQAKEFGLISHLTNDETLQKHDKTAQPTQSNNESISNTANAHLAIQSAHSLITELKTRSPDAVLASKRIINRMYKQNPCTLYLEKLWQIKLLLGYNRKTAVKKAKDSSIVFLKRQFN